jgi:hypothetical protein
MYDLGHKKRQERGICRKINMLKPKFHKSSLDVKIQLFNHTRTCESSDRSIFLPILRVPSVPPVNFQNLLPVKKIKYNKILTYIL